MSYRNRNDSYDKRPSYTGSDRDRERAERGRDSGTSRDRGNDRDDYRRSSDRDQGRDRETSRGASSSHHTSIAKLDTSVAKARQDSLSGSAASGISPSVARPKSESTTQDISKILKEVFAVGLDRIQIKIEEKSLDHMIQERTKTHEKSRHRHADYPSLVEKHEEFLRAQKPRQEGLKQRRAQNEDKYGRLTDSLANELVNGLPALAERKQTQKAADIGQLQTLQERVGSLAKSTEGHDKQVTQLEAKQKALEEENKSLGKQVKDLEAANKTLHERFEDQGKLISALSKKMGEIEGSIRTERDERLSLTQALQDELKADISSVRKESQDRASSLNTTVSTLGSKLESVEGSLSTFGPKLESAEGSLSTFGSKLESVEGSLSTFGPKLESAEGSLSTLGSKLESVEGSLATVQSRAAEKSVNTALPETNINVGSLRESIRATDKKLDQEISAFKKSQENLTRVFGGMVDDMRQKNTAIDNRTAKLEASSAPDKESMASLLSQIQEVKDKYETMEVSITSINDALNNITTKDLADYIIGHMTTHFQNPVSIQDDIQTLAAKVKACETKVEQEVEHQLKERYNSDHLRENLVDPRGTKKRRIDSGQSPLGNGVVNGHRNGSVNGRGHTGY